MCVCACVCAGSGTLSRLLPAQAAPLPAARCAVRGEPCGGPALTSSLKFERHHLRKIRTRALTHSRRLDAESFGLILFSLPQNFPSVAAAAGPLRADPIRAEPSRAAGTCRDSVCSLSSV